jgi:hypothetical protein
LGCEKQEFISHRSSRGIFVGDWLSDFLDLGGWLLQLSQGVFTRSAQPTASKKVQFYVKI